MVLRATPKLDGPDSKIIIWMVGLTDGPLEIAVSITNLESAS